MSVFDISYAGLQSQSAAIQITSNNVANASTTAYKARESLFVDQYFKAVQSGGSSGVQEFGTKRVDIQGSMKASTSALDLGIQGQGMFRMASMATGDGGSKYYSRNGSFSVDNQGYIVNANGLYLTGYQPNSTLTSVIAGATPSALKLPPSEVAPLISTTGTVNVNLDTRNPLPQVVIAGSITNTGKTFLATDPSTYNSSTTVQVYDSKGVPHQVSLYFQKIDPTVVSDPRSTVNPPTTSTAVQYRVYMQADGATLAKAPGGGVGTASLATATATALGAKLLSDAAASAAATLDDKIATNVGDLATLSGTFATLLKVPTMGLDKDSGGELVSKTSNDWQTAKTALVTANQAKAATDTAVTTADAAVKAAGGDAKATPAQIKARDEALVAQGLANDNKDEKVTAEDDAATAFSNAVEAYKPAAAPSATDIAMAAAIVAYNDANEAVTASALSVNKPGDGARAIYDAAFKANAEAVAKNSIGTLQFVDGQLLGSLTKDYTGKGPSVPTVFTAQLSDAQNLLLYGVKFDLSSMTAFGSADIVREASANGYAPGALSGVNVDSAGLITGQYSNGKTLVGGQLVLASFASSDGLQPASGTVFTETFASGAAVLGSGTTGSFGSIRSSSLEQSNIDMAAELVNLMIQQRNYQANSQGVSAANTVMTTAINMGR